MPTVYDALQLAAGTSWVTDGSTRNNASQSEMSLVEPITVDDVDGDGAVNIGDVFNGSDVTEVGTFGGTVLYDNGATKSDAKGVYVTTEDGNTYLLFPDGANIENITFLTATASPEPSGYKLAGFEQDDDVTVACFTRGTLIRTPGGYRPVDQLADGDLVVTKDAGPQALCWVGHSRVRATAASYPVRIPARMLQSRGDLVLSRQHRIALSGWAAELHFGVSEVLAKAKDFVGLGGAQYDRVEGTVDYYHLLFETHQLVDTAGVWTESYHPAAHTAVLYDAETEAEVLSLFPDLARGASQPSVRMELKSREAQLLVAAALV